MWPHSPAFLQTGCGGGASSGGLWANSLTKLKFAARPYERLPGRSRPWPPPRSGGMGERAVPGRRAAQVVGGLNTRETTDWVSALRRRGGKPLGTLPAYRPDRRWSAAVGLVQASHLFGLSAQPAPPQGREDITADYQSATPPTARQNYGTGWRPACRAAWLPARQDRSHPSAVPPRWALRRWCRWLVPRRVQRALAPSPSSTPLPDTARFLTTFPSYGATKLLRRYRMWVPSVPGSPSQPPPSLAQWNIQPLWVRKQTIAKVAGARMQCQR